MVEPSYSRANFIDLLEDVCKDDALLEEFVVEWEIALLKYKSAEEFLVSSRLRGHLDSGCLNFYGFEDVEAFAKWLDTFYIWIREHGVPE